MSASLDPRLALAIHQAERKKLIAILHANKKKNFVQRILAPGVFPVLNMPNGEVRSHYMASAEADGAGYAYPTVVQMPGQKELKQLPPDEAWKHAVQSGELIRFDSPQEAEWFSKNYKKVWRR